MEHSAAVQGDTSGVGLAPARGPWLVSPAFDLLLIANVGWLLALVPGFVSGEGEVHLAFWQIYFLTTPHRWLTLFLVAADDERRGRRTGLFVALALAAALAVLAGQTLAGGLACLAMADYLWNAWHYGAQHARVCRLYSLPANGVRPILENWGVPLFVSYVIVRSTFGATLLDAGVPAFLFGAADTLAFMLPAALITWECLAPLQAGKRAYLFSVCGLYSLLLLSAQLGWPRTMAALLVASAAFHATEYFALVSCYVWQRRERGQPSLFRAWARYWVRLLAAFVLLFGLWSALATATWPEAWLALNLWAALVHYACDGLIWKPRASASAGPLSGPRIAISAGSANA